MTPEESKDIVLHLLHKVFTQGNTAAFRAFGTPNVTLHLAGYPDSFRGPDALQKWATTYLAAFEVQHIIDDVAADWSMFDTLSVMQQLGVFPKGRPPRALMWLIVRLQRLDRKRGEKPA
jgi:hypothetical protein